MGRTLKVNLVKVFFHCKPFAFSEYHLHLNLRHNHLHRSNFHYKSGLHSQQEMVLTINLDSKEMLLTSEKPIQYFVGNSNLKGKKFRLRETKNLLTDAHSSTDTKKILLGRQYSQKKKFSSSFFPAI